MKSLEQNYRKGTLEVVDLPNPKAAPGRVVVRTAASLASVGTEKAMVELARKSLLGKARARPDLVKQVLDKVRTDGMLETWRQVMGRLETPIQLGYSSAGTVIEVGPGVDGFRTGDRVACTGSGYAGHAEVTSVPAKLCALVPDEVDFQSASFVALGGIALESVRMAGVELGSRVVVIGLGLLGQIAVQLLNAAGVHVFGIDVDSEKAVMALSHGAEETAVAGSGMSVTDAVSAWTGGNGADAVIIMASTERNEPLEQASEMCRDRARIVATGMIGLDVPRREFYDKELELVVSRAWGPGLYDPRYTSGAVDYPLPYARWTAERNAQEFLSQLSKGAVSTEHLVSHRFPIEDAAQAYEMILAGGESYLGVVLTYSSPEVKSAEASSYAAEVQSGIAEQQSESKVFLIGTAGSAKPEGSVGIGVIGAGLFANGTLLPAMKGLNTLSRRGIAARTGLQVRHTGKKFGFQYCTTETQDLLSDSDVDLVTVLTRHDSHASHVIEALRAGKHVFVEKPLAIDEGQLHSISEAYRKSRSDSDGGPLVMVGFNRRFSPMARWLKERLAGIGEQIVVNCVVNAGSLPSGSWVDDPIEGGGRIVGEVCHFVDLVQYLTSALPVRVFAERIGRDNGDDSLVATLTMANGAIASITYVAGGDRRYPRERVEVFGGGAAGAIDNFRSAVFMRNGKRQSRKARGSIDRGHGSELQELVGRIREGGPPPVGFDEYVSTTLATFALERSLRSRTSELVEYTNSPV